ncbi:MAG: hypothetical protein RJA44_576 [Pseudomonadota bacterium]
MNTRLDTQQQTQERLTELEIKISFNDDLLDELNRIVAQQQHQIEQLRRELKELRQQMPDASGPRSLREELPPHY